MRLYVAAALALTVAALLSVNASASFSLSANINAPAADVRAFIVDLPRFTRLHPLAVSCKPVHQDPTAYEVVDRVSYLGLWESTINVDARIITQDEKTIVVETQAPMNVRTKSVWTVECSASNPQATTVSEQFSISAPLGLLYFSKFVALDAHKLLLSALKANLEGKQT